MSQSNAEWLEGYNSALALLNIEVDKVLATCYNDVRTKDSLLDVKSAINQLKEYGKPDAELLSMQ